MLFAFLEPAYLIELKDKQTLLAPSDNHMTAGHRSRVSVTHRYVTVVEEFSQVSVVNRNKYSKALDSGEARESCCRQSSFQQPHVEKVDK